MIDHRMTGTHVYSACVIYLQECGGIMTLTDVYCRINRARGMAVSVVTHGIQRDIELIDIY